VEKRGTVARTVPLRVRKMVGSAGSKDL
jgi:hypothetical protein